MSTVVVLSFVLAFQSAPDPAPPLLSTTASTASMPAEPMQMSGLPLQVGDLPPGTVAVRVIRQSFANDVVDQPVELQVLGVNGLMLEEKTDAAGRATFRGITVGRTVLTRTSVDGESLMSQQFEMPAQGGVRLVLVAGAGAGGAGVHGAGGAPSEPASMSMQREASAERFVTSPPADLALWAATILGCATVGLGVWWSRRWRGPEGRTEERS